METIALVLLLLVNSHESLTCEDSYEIPAPVAKALSKEKGAVIEIREQDAQGYIFELFYNRIYFEGIFILRSDSLTACAITRALKLDEEGKIEFMYDESQREM